MEGSNRDIAAQSPAFLGIDPISFPGKCICRQTYRPASFAQDPFIELSPIKVQSCRPNDGQLLEISFRQRLVDHTFRGFRSPYPIDAGILIPITRPQLPDILVPSQPLLQLAE